MTWIQDSPTETSWSTQSPYSLFNFLLQENGDFLLQETNSMILLEGSWGIHESVGNWTKENPSPAVWT